MSKPPLWEVMENATGTVAEWDVVIRALADWLVPREKELPDSVHGGTRFARQAERRRLRNLLISEAVRAERGEVKT